jgi:hypothetical protein
MRWQRMGQAVNNHRSEEPKTNRMDILQVGFETSPSEPALGSVFMEKSNSFTKGEWCVLLLVSSNCKKNILLVVLLATFQYCQNGPKLLGTNLFHS